VFWFEGRYYRRTTISLIVVENDLGDDNSGSENTAGVYFKLLEILSNKLLPFNWGQASFRIRGLTRKRGDND
jgi:hypothetical protein